MFVDDIVICSESREQVEVSLEKVKVCTEEKGSKTEYMCINGRESSRTVQLQEADVVKVDEF